MEYELEFYESELDLLKTPEALKLYLHCLHEMHELTDITDLESYYVDIEAYEFAQVVADFQKFINENK